MELLIESLARAGVPVLHIDPHGSSAKRVERMTWSLPQRLQRNFLTIRPCDTRRIVSINPLAVPRNGHSDLDWHASLTSKVGHVSRIELAAWGETDFNSRPRMFTWTTRVNKTLGSCGLTIPDAKYFLDVRSPVYESLIRAVPDLMARHAFEDLARRRPTEIDEQIESTRTRMLGFLENPIIEATLGRAEGALDMSQVIADGMSLIIDLEPRGLLRDEDQQILANLFLTEFIYTVMNLPEDYRRPYFIFIDELPVFASSFPLLLKTMCEIRKFKTRFVLAHQGTQRFPDGTQDRFLNTIISQCGVHVLLRHVNPVDAKFFGELLALPAIDPHKKKHEQHQEVQYQAGHQLVTLIDESDGQTLAEQAGGSESTGTNEQASWNDDTSDSTSNTRGTQRDQHILREVVSEAQADTLTRRSGRGGSSGRTHEQGSSWSRTNSRTASRTKKQTLIPQFAFKDVVTSVQFYSVEEQTIAPATRLASLVTGEAIVHVSGRGIVEVKFPLAKDPFRLTPKFAAKKAAEYYRRLYERPEYATPQEIFELRRQLLDAILQHLQTITDESPALFATQPQPLPVAALHEQRQLPLHSHTDTAPLNCPREPEVKQHARWNN
jgi:hypothetical protein